MKRSVAHLPLHGGQAPAWLFQRMHRLAGSIVQLIVIDAGPVDSFELESVTAFVRGKFYLARLADGGFLALSRNCTHLGCSIPWVEKEKTFACPCHGSAFDITGNVINAPAPRALDIYPLTIENRIVRVDTLKPIKRSTYHIDQVTYPKKV